MTKIRLHHAAALALFAASQLAHAGTPSVGSREYKVLLNPQAFQSAPADAANRFLTDLKASLAANGFDSSVKKSFAADHDRSVLYYDTAGNCAVKTAGYSMRQRNESGSLDIELKFGSASQGTSANTDVSGSSSKAKTKLEDDITPPARRPSRIRPASRCRARRTSTSSATSRTCSPPPRPSTASAARHWCR